MCTEAGRGEVESNGGKYSVCLHTHTHTHILYLYNVIDY